MAGNQCGFNYTCDSDIKGLFTVVSDKLEEYMSSYNLSEEAIVYIEITIRQKDKKLLSEFSLPSCDGKHNITHIPKFHIFKVENYLSIPVSINEDYLGKPLPVDISNGLITHIHINIDDKLVNFLDSIINSDKLLRTNHKDKITSFDGHFKFYLLKDRYDYVLAVKILAPDSVYKIKYSIRGVVLSYATDRAVNEVILRDIGEKQLVIRGKNVISSTYNIKLKALDKVTSQALFVENDNIGVIDIETYKYKDIIKVYAIGFKTNLDEKPVIYYIDKHDLDYDKIVINLVNELVRPKYSNVRFYCHNLKGHVVVYILNTLYAYNVENNPEGEDKYEVTPKLRGDDIIKVRIAKGKHSLTILDSLCMLPEKLSTLGDNFGVPTIKSVFPYSFATQDNLFYEGRMPSIDHYDNLSLEAYNNMSVHTWSFKNESIRYLTNDLFSLHEVLTKANKQVFLDYNLDMTKSITISGLSLNLFFKDFYNTNIPNINKASLYKDIRQAYYGGITEVYKPSGTNLYYYDVNSLYPYVALQDMPGLTCKKVFFFEGYEDISQLFGYFYCRIETPLDDYLGLLPIRTNTGLKFPLGQWEGWYFSEQLKFVKDHGYKIKVLKGYTFYRVSDVFTGYINKVYPIKSNATNKSQKVMAKSLLNNLLGRFGINIDRPVTELLTRKAFYKKMLMHKIMSYKVISKDNILVNYVPKLDYDIITDHGLDFMKLLDKYKDSEIQSLSATSVAISAAVTAYARIHINKLKLDIISRGAKIYYSDTDSVVTDIELPKCMVDSNKLGFLKVERILDEAIFISNKLYWLSDIKGKKIE